MQKFVCQYNFSIALEKLNLKKSPISPPHVHTCVLWAKVPFHSFSFFCFLQVECRDFTWSTTNFTFHQSNRSQIKLLYMWQRLHMPEWKALNVRGRGSGPKPKNLRQWIQCSMSLRLQSFYRADINIRADLLRISVQVMEDRQCIEHSVLIIQLVFPSADRLTFWTVLKHRVTSLHLCSLDRIV